MSTNYSPRTPSLPPVFSYNSNNDALFRFMTSNLISSSTTSVITVQQVIVAIVNATASSVSPISDMAEFVYDSILNTLNTDEPKDENNEGSENGSISTSTSTNTNTPSKRKKKKKKNKNKHKIKKQQTVNNKINKNMNNDSNVNNNDNDDYEEDENISSNPTSTPTRLTNNVSRNTTTNNEMKNNKHETNRREYSYEAFRMCLDFTLIIDQLDRISNIAEIEDHENNENIQLIVRVIQLILYRCLLLYQSDGNDNLSMNPFLIYFILKYKQHILRKKKNISILHLLFIVLNNEINSGTIKELENFFTKNTSSYITETRNLNIDWYLDLRLLKDKLKFLGQDINYINDLTYISTETREKLALSMSAEQGIHYLKHLAHKSKYSHHSPTSNDDDFKILTFILNFWFVNYEIYIFSHISPFYDALHDAMLDCIMMYNKDLAESICNILLDLPFKMEPIQRHSEKESISSSSSNSGEETEDDFDDIEHIQKEFRSKILLYLSRIEPTHNVIDYIHKLLINAEDKITLEISEKSYLLHEFLAHSFLYLDVSEEDINYWLFSPSNTLSSTVNSAVSSSSDSPIPERDRVSNYQQQKRIKLICMMINSLVQKNLISLSDYQFELKGLLVGWLGKCKEARDLFFKIN